MKWGLCGILMHSWCLIYSRAQDTLSLENQGESLNHCLLLKPHTNGMQYTEHLHNLQYMKTPQWCTASVQLTTLSCIMDNKNHAVVIDRAAS